MSDVPWWADPDPWAMSPADQEALDEIRRKFKAAMEAIPDEPPVLRTTHE